MSENSKKRKISRNAYQYRQKPTYTTTYLKTPFSISLSSQPSTQRNLTKNKMTFKRIIKHNVTKYNCSVKQFGVIYINNLIESKNCHSVAKFKDYMLSDFIDEFLRREYAKEESLERIPKFANYYKNYLTFFCKPIFCDFYFNSIVQNYGEAKAEIYYNSNYGKKKKKKKLISDKMRTLFSETIKKDIDNGNIITQGNNNENLSISLSESSRIINNNNITKNSIESSLISVLDAISKKDKKKPKPLTENHLLTGNVFNSRNHQISDRLKSSHTNEIKHKTVDIQSPRKSVKISSKPQINVQTIQAKSPTSRTSNNNKYKISLNHPIHIKTLSSINTYNKIIKQTIPISKKNKISFTAKSPTRNAELLNANLNNIMKLTLKMYQSKIPHTRSLSGAITHSPTSPTINNFNININNHICFNGNNSNSNSSAKSNEAKKTNRKINLKDVIEMNKTSRNKKKPLIRTNTETNKMLFTTGNFFDMKRGVMSPSSSQRKKIVPKNQNNKLVFPISKTERLYKK